MPQRDTMLAAASAGDTFDLIVVGGGANGAGIALDAASRGLRVALIEANDFAAGTSSRSSKLIHGGLRYVGLGQWSLVREALAERHYLLQNAPHLVRPLRFVVPAYGVFDQLKFALGLKIYDWLAGQHKLESSASLTAAAVAEVMPNLEQTGLRAALSYSDALFDDARLVIELLLRAVDLGAVVTNYTRVIGLEQSGTTVIKGVRVYDELSGTEFSVRARVVINACGVDGDALRRLEQASIKDTVTPSQGSHLVVSGQFLESEHALVFPETPDGRIMFAIPWFNHTLLGTTDKAVAPGTPAQPMAAEVEEILKVAGRYLKRAPQRRDVLSQFAGLRPLAGGNSQDTIAQSREHAFSVSPGGLVSISGGKWTTYRLIAEQVVDLAIKQAGLAHSACRTKSLALGSEPSGRDDEVLHPRLPYRVDQIRRAVTTEMAQSVFDVLAYRTRALFIDAAAAIELIPACAEILAAHFGWTDERCAEEKIEAENKARCFLLTPTQAHGKHD